MKAIYKITVLNWDRHNPNMKHGHKKTLIANNFCTDAKLGAMPVTVRWMFLGILLTCGDHTRDTVEMGERQMRDLLESSWSIERALASLQSLQLLTFEKVALIEEKRREKKRREEKRRDATPRAPSASPRVSDVVSHYCERWKERYSSSPPISGKAAGQIKRLVLDHGERRAKEFIEAYVAMPDSWFVTKRHDVGTLLENLNAVAQFADTGKMLTRAHLQKLNDQLDETMGPRPPTIEEIKSGKLTLIEGNS